VWSLEKKYLLFWQTDIAGAILGFCPASNCEDESGWEKRRETTEQKSPDRKKGGETCRGCRKERKYRLNKVDQ
jgi:hypothetical protein